MAITAVSTSSSSSFFTSHNLHFNSHTSRQSITVVSSSLRFANTRVFATADRTATAPDQTVGCFYDTNSSSLYDVLRVGVGADAVEVKAAYRRLARVLHPDVGGCDSSADEFMKVHSAYMTLVDPEKRAAYDRSLVQRRNGFLSRMGSAGSYRWRRWETDQCW